MRPGSPGAAGATIASGDAERGAAERRQQRSQSLPPLTREDAKLETLVRRRIGAVLVLVSLLPIAMLGVGAWVHFRGLHLKLALQQQQNAATTHASAVDFYLAERLRALQLASLSYRFDELTTDSRLQGLFDNLQKSYPKAFVDLGVIDARGRHLAYLGPYRLADKNYRNAPWFRTVMSSGTYISDVFLGFRKVPHCVIAVKRIDAGRVWVLRATINNDSLHALVRAGAPDAESDAYLINRGSILQTPSRTRQILEPAAVEASTIHRDEADGQPLDDRTRVIRAAAGLNEGRWLLVLEQPADRILEPVSRVARRTAGLLALFLALVAAATLVATRHLNAQVDRANVQRNRLRDELVRSARLASLGEMASGLAHEINNPLAVLGAERTNLADVLTEANLGPALMEEVQRSLDRCQRQVRRCADITGKMLQFSRRSEPRVVPVDVEAVAHEVRDLFSHSARGAQIELRLAIATPLPAVLVDPNELEQVLVNLVNNALYALQGQGVVVIGARQSAAEVLLWVQDDGCGVASEDLDRMFQPFFTTKPPGAGTGLGLSVCHGLVSGWGGRIEAESRWGEGTTLRVFMKATETPAPERATVSSASRSSREHDSVFGEAHDEHGRAADQDAAGG